MKRIFCTLLLSVFALLSQAQIGVFQKVITDSSFSKDYRFRSLPNYSLYNGITNIISPTTGTYDLTTPPGTTAQRPTVPAGKYILRYNTDSAALEIGDPNQVWKILTTGSVQTFDTSSIENFGLKVRSLLSATSPLQYNSVTGNFSIPQATSSVAGYLASADWVTFNTKLPDPGSNGIVVRTASGITAARQLVAASNNISLVNANGVSGNPSIDINDTLALSQLYIPLISPESQVADSAVYLNRTTGYLEVRPVPAGGAVTANIGLGYRLVATPTGNIKTVFGSNTTIIDSTSNANALTFKVDTSEIATQYDLTQTANISNASLVANGNYTQNWNNKQWVVDSIAASLLFRSGGIGNTGTVRKEFSISWPGSSFADQFDVYNIWSALRKSDNSADSLRLGLLSGGTGTLSMGHYDVANAANNTYISYSNLGLIDITAKDSIWIKGATPVATADSVLGLLDRPNGRSRIVKIPFGATQLNDSSFVVGGDTITIGGTYPSWQQTLNVSPNSYGRLLFDTSFTKPAGVGDPATHTWFTMNPLVPADDTVTSPFYWNQFAGLNNGQVNEVMVFGWNLSPGGGNVQANKPALGESWESNYRVDIGGGVLRRYMEKHEYYISKTGGQYRLGSYTIDTDAGTCNYYHSVDNFNLRNFGTAGTNTPYFSIQGTANLTEASWLNNSNQAAYFRTSANFNQDANTANFTLSSVSGKPANLFNVTGFTQAALPNSVFSRSGYDGSQIQFNGATTGALARWVSDSAQTMISTFTNVAMRFMPNTAQALDLRSTRVNIYQPTGIGTGVITPIAQLDVRNSTLNQTIYCENTKAGGFAGIFTTVNGAGNNFGLDVNASGGSNNKGINFAIGMGVNDWNIYSSGASKTYLNGKVQLGTTAEQARKLYVNGSIGANKDSLPIITTIGSRYLLTIDTTVGDDLHRFKRILPSNLGFATGNTLYTGDGTLDGSRTVSTAGFTTTWTGANDGETSFSVVNTGTTNANAISGTVSGTTSIGVTGTSSQYIGVYGTSTSNNGVQGESSSGVGVVGVSTTGAAFRGQINPSSTNAIENIATLLRTTSSGAGANGLGAAIQYELETATSGTSQVAGSLAFKWTDATNATRTSQFSIVGVNNAANQTVATFDGNGNATFGTTNSIVGTTTNNDAVAGNIGEEVSSYVSTYTNYTATATYQNVTSITLTPGDWDLSAFFSYSSNSATITAGANGIFVISTTTASAAGSTEGKNIAYVPQAALLGTSIFSDAISPYRVSIASTTTYYLNTQATFTVGNPQYVGGLRARRIR